MIIFQGVLTKLKFPMKFPYLSKFIDLMKELKYEHKRIFSCWGGSNFILGTGSENQLLFSENSSQCQFLSQNCQKMTLA